MYWTVLYVTEGRGKILWYTITLSHLFLIHQIMEVSNNRSWDNRGTIKLQPS